MAGTVFWGDDSDAYDTIAIGEAFFENTKIDISGDLENAFDVKKAPGADGAPSTNKGYDPCRPTVTWVLWTKEHFETYEAMLAIVQPKPGKVAPPVVRVIHPILWLYKKERFKVTKLHMLKYLGSSQWEARIDLLEHFDAPKPVAKPKNNEQAPKGSRRERLGLEYQLNKPSNNVVGPGERPTRGERGPIDL